MYIDKITINEPLGGGVKEFKVFDEKKYEKLIKKNNNKILDAILFLTSNGEYTTTTSWPVNETGNHLIMDSNGVKAITSWDEENGYRKIIYNRDPLLYIYCRDTNTIHLNGEDINLPMYDNYFEIDKIEQGSTFSSPEAPAGVLRAIEIKNCKLPPSLKGLFFDNMNGPVNTNRIEIVVDDSIIDMEETFYFCGFKTINTSDWDTSNVVNMYSMFQECTDLTSPDVSKWDTSNVVNMGYMFANCTSLQSLDVSKWDTSSVTNMSKMFANCMSLQSLDVSKWDTSNVIYMQYMFDGCDNLEYLDVSKWDTSSVTNMSEMFYNCMSLQSLDLSNWDTSSVTNMSEMFYNCMSLQSLDLSNWDTSSVTTMKWMFNNCPKLTNLKFPGMGKIQKSGMLIALSDSPLDHDSLMSIFTYNRTETGLSTLTVNLNSTSKGYLTEEEKVEITAKGYTIA